MKIEVLALDLQLALSQGNSTDAAFATVGPFLTEPGAAQGSGTAQDGIWPLPPITTGETTNNQLLVLPFADAGPDSTFSVRLFGWKRATWPQSQNVVPVWLPFFLCELACTTADLPGPQSTGQLDAMPQTSNLCDTITLVQGDLGFYGRINSVGAAGTGSNLPAYAKIDLQGAQKFQFLFQWNDQLPPSGMNAFWTYL